MNAKIKKHLPGFMILLAACQPVAEQRSNLTHTLVDTTATQTIAATDGGFEDTSAYATYYLAIADTGKDYYLLDKRMYELSKGMKLEVDTMNRHYNKDKDRIVLSEKDEDEMYRGEYFPRRFPSETLSLEYLDAFDDKAGEKTIALVAGIYETQQQANDATKILRQQAPNTYVHKAKVYIGCMH